MAKRKGVKGNSRRERPAAVSSAPWTPVFNQRALVVLLLILAAATAVRLYAFNGYVGLDDAEYARFAFAVAEGRDATTGYTGPAVFPLRVGTYVPTAVCFRLFGMNEWTMALYPLMTSLASIVVIYVCGALIFGWQSGLTAAALLGASHWDIDSATTLLPDLPSAFYALAGVTLLLWLSKRPSLRTAALMGGGVLAGVAFGLSWLSTETVAYLVPFMLLLIFLTIRQAGPRLRHLWLGFILGAGVVLFGEIATYATTTGDALFRLHEIERSYRQWKNGFISYLYPVYYAAIILVAGFLTQAVLSERWWTKPRRFAEVGGAVVVAVLLLWVATPSLSSGALVRPTGWASEVRMLADEIRPDTLLYADSLTLRAFEFFDRYPKQTSWISFEQLSASDDVVAGGTVIVNNRYLEWLDRNAGMWVAWPAPGETDRSGYRQHSFYEAPPDTWSVVWKNDNATMYRVGAVPAAAGKGGAKGGESR